MKNKSLLWLLILTLITIMQISFVITAPTLLNFFCLIIDVFCLLICFNSFRKTINNDE